jgi:hypothetical protein
MAIAPAALVGAIPRVALPFGLFSVFTFRGGAERWQSGVRWEAGTCDEAGGIGDPDCADPPVAVGLPKALDSNLAAWGEASPFTVYGHYTCTPLGSASFAAAQDGANAHLAAREEGRVEKALWTGDLGNYPNLAGAGADAPDPTTLAGGVAMELGSGLALLEDFIGAAYGGLGVLHLTRGTALQAFGRGLLKATGGRLSTGIGTPVVAGGGYPGTGPGATPPGNVAGTAWGYVSPALIGYRSEVFTSSNAAGDLLDRATNDLYAIAERNYLLGFDPCGVGAVLFDLNAAPGAKK